MAYELHPDVQGPGHYAQLATGAESNQVVELPVDWKIRYLMCSVVPRGAVGGTVAVYYSLFGTAEFYDSGKKVDLANPQPVVFDDCIDRVKFVPDAGVDGDWDVSVSQARA